MIIQIIFFYIAFTYFISTKNPSYIFINNPELSYHHVQYIFFFQTILRFLFFFSILCYSSCCYNRCTRAGLKQITCPSGLSFDLEKQTCDWKAKVSNCDKLESKSQTNNNSANNYFLLLWQN